MPPNNLKQADVLEGATVLPNPNGSAPGQWLDTTFDGYRKLILLIPGPPNECRPLFDDECLPRLREVAAHRAHIAKRTLRAAMIPESQADKLLAPIYTTYTDVETTILAHAGDIQLTLLCAKSNPEAAQERVDELASRLEEALEDWLYSSARAESLEQIVLYYLGLRQSTLAVAESCTGGMIAERITIGPRQLALLSRRSGRLLRRPQDPPSPASLPSSSPSTAPSRRSGTGPGRRHPPPHRRNHRTGHYRHRRPHRRHRLPSPSAWSTSPSPTPNGPKSWIAPSAATASASANGPPSKPWTWSAAASCSRKPDFL